MINTADRVEAIDDFIVTAYRPGLSVWCGADTLAEAYGPFVFVFDRATQAERDVWRTSLANSGYPQAAEVCIGQVLPGEIERWTEQGYFVLCDCPLSLHFQCVGVSARIQTPTGSYPLGEH